MRWLLWVFFLAFHSWSALACGTEGKKPAVLFLHGWGGSPSTWSSAADVAQQSGFEAFNPEMPWSGRALQHAPHITRAQMFEAARAEYDVIANNPAVDTSCIYIAGTSAGSYVAILLSKERRFAGMILHAIAAYPDKGYASTPLSRWIDVPEAHQRLIVWRATNAASHTRMNAALRAFSGSILFLISENDNLVTAQASRNITGRVIKKLVWTIRGAGHNLSDAQLAQVATDVIGPWLRITSSNKLIFPVP